MSPICQVRSYSTPTCSADTNYRAFPKFRFAARDRSGCRAVCSWHIVTQQHCLRSSMELSQESDLPGKPKLPKDILSAANRYVTACKSYASGFRYHEDCHVDEISYWTVMYMLTLSRRNPSAEPEVSSVVLLNDKIPCNSIFRTLS